MKIALLADIHANAAALAAVLADARAQGVEELAVAGDLVGYYHEPAEVLRLLDAWPWSGVRGNHEALLEAWLAGDGRADYHARYGSGLAQAAEQLPETQLRRLLDLPEERRLARDGHDLLLCHGAPGEPERYVYPDADAATLALFDAADADVVAFGHTHHPVIWRRGRTTVVNPGSVGQPRNRVPGAHWALWDIRAGTISPKLTTYDPAPVIAACRRFDPHLPYNADVLTRRGET